MNIKKMKIFNRWVIQKEFWCRLALSTIFILLLLVHQLIPNFKFDIYSTIFILLAVLTWFTKRLTSLEIPGIIKIDLKDLDTAKTLVGYSPKTGDEEIEIKWNQEERKVFSITKGITSILAFKARINYTHEAGANYLLKVFVNGEPIGIDKLVNKPIIKENADGRKYKWFDEKFDSWMLCYSPNFKDNYFHPIYKVLYGDPYLFVFKIDKNIIKDDEVEIVLKHNGRSERDAFRNSIIVEGIEIK